MGQNCFKSLCEDVGPNASQLDFSVFETDIVQIAAFDNEGYYRLGDKYGKDNEIIEAVEVRESQCEAFRCDSNNVNEYEYLKDVPHSEGVSITTKEPPQPQNTASPLPNDVPNPEGRVSENAPFPHRNSAPQLPHRNSLRGTLQPKDNTLIEAPRPHRAFSKNVQRQHSISAPQLPQRNTMKDTPPRPHINISKEGRQPPRSPLPPLPQRHFIKGAPQMKRKLFKDVSQSQDSLSKNTSQPRRNSQEDTCRQHQTAIHNVPSLDGNITSIQEVLQPDRNSSKSVYWEITDVIDKVDDNQSRSTPNVIQHDADNKRLVAAIDFGTACSGWAYSLREDFLADTNNVTVKCWSSGDITSYKTPTCVLLSADGSRVLAFGYEAEQKYRALVKEGRHMNCYLFSRFKLELHKLINKLQGIQLDMELVDITGKRLLAKHVLSLSIGWLKDDITSEIKRRHTNIVEDDIFWVLAIPAVYSRTTKQFMREAANQAGIQSKKLSIVLEPDVVSMICHHELEMLSDLNLKKAGSQYIIIDAGGETVDLLGVEIDITNSPKIISTAYASHLGGINVDRAFERLMKDIFGSRVFQKFTDYNRDEFMDLMQEFKTLKRSLLIDSEENILVTVPSSLIKIYHAKTAKQMDENKILRHLGMTVTKNKLHCKASVLKELFKETCEDITKHVNLLLEKDKLTNVTAIIMVGGFSESAILQETLRESFPYLHVRVLKDASLCVLKGAVMHGHRQSC